MAIRVGGIEFVVRANVSQASQAFTTLGRQGKNLQNNLRQTKTLFGGLGSQLGKLRSGLAAVAGAFAGFKLANFIKDATLLAARVQNLGTVLNNVGRIAGFNSAQIRNVENSVKSLGITTRAARQSLAQLSQANLDLRKASQLTRIAQDAAVIAGIDSSEAFNRLVVSVQRNDVRLLRNLGIVINLNSIYQKFAQTTGRTAASLTAFEKRQLLLNEVIDRGRLITGTYEASLNDSFKQLTSLRRVVEEATRVFGEQFEPVLAKVVGTAGKFLKAFTEGRSAIGPRFVAVVSVAAIAITALATAFTVLAAAVGTIIGIIGGPLTIALVALAAVIGIGTAAWVNHQLEVAEAEKRIKKVGEEAENTAQAIVDSAERIDRIRDLADRPFGISEDELRQFRADASALAAAFPKLAKQIEAAAELGPQRVIEVFSRELPDALRTSEENIKQFEENNKKAQIGFRAELKKTLLAQRGFTDERIKQINDVQRLGNDEAQGIAVVSRETFALAEARQAVEKETERLLGSNNELTESYIQSEALFVQNTESLKEFGDTIIATNRAITQLRQAKLTLAFQEFQVGLAQLEQGANQAVQILSKLESERLRLFKGTNVGIISDFNKAQSQLIAVDIRTKEQLVAAAEAFEKTQRAESVTIRNRRIKDLEVALKREEITEKEGKERRVKILKEFAKTQERVTNASRKLIQDGEEQQNIILKARTKSIENVTAALRKQEDATRDLLELEELTAKGIDTRLIRLRRKFQDETRRLTRAQIELDVQLQRVEKQLDKAGAGGLSRFLRGTAKIPDNIKKNLTGPIGNLVSQLITLNRAFEANRKELLAREKKLNAEFENEVKRRNKKLIEEQQALNQRLLELRDPAAAKLSTLSGVQAAVEEIKEGGESVDEFIRELQLGLDDKATPGVARLTNKFSEFNEVLGKTVNESQLKILAEQFPNALSTALEASKKELRDLQAELKKFQEIEKPKQQRDDRIERQRRFNQLVDAGVPAFKARQEVQRIELEQRKELDAKEKALQDKVKEQTNRQRELAKVREELEKRFTAQLEKQKAVIAEQVALRQKLVMLRNQEIAQTEKQLGQIKKQQQTLNQFAQGGVGQRQTPGGGPGAGAPGAVTGGPPGAKVPASVASLTKEAKALAAAQKRRDEALDLGLAQTQSSLREIRQTADSQSEDLEDAIALIARDAEAGRAAFKKLRLARKR